ncbi:unnamed protein product [Closterium sp. NIES-65]|nr:unnamed protein product [Closterium sp. NIES-65]
MFCRPPSVSPVLAVSTSAPAIKSFDVASGASLGDVAARHPGTVTDLGFAEAAFGGAGPGKEVLLSSSSESAVYVWDARARSQAGVFPAHGGAGELWSCSGGGGSTGHLLAAGANSQVRRAPTPPRPPHKSALHLAGAFPAPRMGDQASCGAAEGGTQSTCWRQGATHRAPAGGGRQLPGEALTGGGGIWQTVGTILQRGRGVYRAPAGGGGGIWQILLWDMRSTRLLGRLEDAHTDDVTQVRFHPLHRTALLSAALDGLICRFDLSPHHEASLSASAVTTPAATAAAERYADSDPLHTPLSCCFPPVAVLPSSPSLPPQPSFSCPKQVISPGTSISRIGFFGPSASALWCLTSVETLRISEFSHSASPCPTFLSPTPPLNFPPSLVLLISFPPLLALLPLLVLLPSSLPLLPPLSPPLSHSLPPPASGISEQAIPMLPFMIFMTCLSPSPLLISSPSLLSPPLSPPASLWDLWAGDPIASLDNIRSTLSEKWPLQVPVSVLFPLVRLNLSSGGLSDSLCLFPSPPHPPPTPSLPVPTCVTCVMPPPSLSPSPPPSVSPSEGSDYAPSPTPLTHSPHPLPSASLPLHLSLLVSTLPPALAFSHPLALALSPPLPIQVDYLISCDYSPSPTPRLRLFAGSHLGHAAAFPISLPHTVSNPSQPSGPVTAAAAAARNDDDDAMMSEDPLGSRVSVPPGSCQVSGPDMLLSGAHSGVVRDVGRVALPPSHAGTAVAYWTGGEDGCLCQWEGIEGQEEGVEGEGVKGRAHSGVVRDVGRVALPAPHAGTAVAYWTGGEDGCLQYTSLHYTDMLLSGAHSGVVRDVGRVALPASHAAVSGGMAVAFWTGGEDGCLCQWEGIEGQEEGLEDGGAKGSKRKGRARGRIDSSRTSLLHTCF